MKRKGSRLILTAIPTLLNARGVSGCFNRSNLRKVTKIFETRNYNIREIDC